MKTDLLKEAIADADAIKKLAVENAKASLNQAFDSKIKSMLAARLQEEADDTDELEEEVEDTDEAKKKSSEEESEKESEDEEAKDVDEEIDINKILAEMEDEDDDQEEEEEEEVDETVEEAEATDKPAGLIGKGAEILKKMFPDLKIDPAKVKEFEQMVSNALANVTGMREEDEMEEEDEDGKEMKEGEKESYDEEVDLDALLKELEMEEGKEESDEDDDMEDEMKEAKKEDEDEDDQDAMSKMKKKHAEELAEIRSQAAELAGKVNETNLINAKLLYLNKILHKHNLSEAQKVKVIAAFDKATNVKEAKIVFESLNEAFGVKNDKSKTNLKESLGFASKAAGTSTKREIITEADVQVARWQKLAGINKTNQ